MKIPDHLDPETFLGYLARTRWFAGKGRPAEVTGVSVIGEVSCRVEGSPVVVVHVVELTYRDDEGGIERYQVPLSFYPQPEGRLDHAFVGWWEDPTHGRVHAYDALHDREAMACWLRSFELAADTGEAGGAEAGALRFHRLPGHDLDMETHSTLFSGEQSNSSVFFGEDAMMKVFRKLTPGINPDIEIHDVLTRAGSEHIARLYGWVETTDPESGEVIQLAMLQEFLRTATDGWDLALASVRGLFADEMHPSESGSDFAGEATRLGEALREVHDTLASHFPTERAAGAAELAEGMRSRLEAALGVVPDLAPYAETLRDLYDRVAGLDSLEIQRIHGDLHLGQTLRISSGWKLVDFEGEPAKPLAERQRPDSKWRDVAGMLRSFDYAPRVVERSLAGDLAGEVSDPQDDDAALRAQHAEEWAERNKNHFLAAYAGRALTDEEQTLVNAYVADKAVYETVYETRNRPTWVSIPLAGVARIGAA